MDGVSSPWESARLACHCLAIESPSGLVLVDTGLGLHDVKAPYPRLSRFFTGLLRPKLDPMETAVRQLERLGFQASDVRHIVLTHLDFDHAGGLEDFPEATVHVYEKELESARARHGLVARGRYRPHQWDAGIRWRTYREGGESWFGLESVRDLAGLPPDILLIPLTGHTWGHCGVAVKHESGWLLHAGDAYFYRDEMAPEYGCTPGLRAYQRLMEVHRAKRLYNQERLRRLVKEHGPEVTVFSAHDPVEFERLAGRTVLQERKAG